MDAEEDRVKRQREIVIGEDLSMLSVEELEERIELLKQEIERITTDIQSKQSSLSAAEAFFKQS